MNVVVAKITPDSKHTLNPRYSDQIKIDQQNHSGMLVGKSVSFISAMRFRLNYKMKRTS